MSEDEERRAAIKKRADAVIEAMCRAICEAQGQDPDSPSPWSVPIADPPPLWVTHAQQCAAKYLDYVAQEVMVREVIQRGGTGYRRAVMAPPQQVAQALGEGLNEGRIDPAIIPPQNGKD